MSSTRGLYRLYRKAGRTVYSIRFTLDGRTREFSARSANLAIAEANAAEIYRRATQERRYLSSTGRALPRRVALGVLPLTVLPPQAGVYWAYCAVLPAFIKIGWSSNIKRRLRHLQTGLPAPLLLLRWDLGNKSDEAALHLRLSAHRAQGEWFRTTPEVMGVLQGRSDTGDGRAA